MTLLDGGDAAALQLAAQRLAGGELVALPTETVYGLGARADDSTAVARIFALKGRPSDHPLIVHVADAAHANFETAHAFAAELAPTAQRLMAHFWPGPLTIVARRRPGVGGAAAGGLPTIGLRCPGHPVAQALLRAALALGVPGVAAPSANRFGRVSPTRAAHVVDEFGTGLMVLDGGACSGGIESTIIDCSGALPALLRPGTLDRRVLESVLGQPLQEATADSPRVPGALASHYAPRATLRLATPPVLAQWIAASAQAAGLHSVGVYSRGKLPSAAGLHWQAMPDNAVQVAHELFAVLRQFDSLNVEQIWVETPPDSVDWDGVRDRLQRAAATPAA